MTAGMRNPASTGGKYQGSYEKNVPRYPEKRFDNMPFFN
jgi:hypothetical protein